MIPKDKKVNPNIFKRFHALDVDGIARVGESLNDGDVYINKHVPDFSTAKPSSEGPNNAGGGREVLNTVDL